MKAGTLVEKVEFEAVTDPITKLTTVKKFKRTRKCIAILKGRLDPATKTMKYLDVSNTDLDMAALDDPDIPHERYIIKYDNISEVEIP